MRTPDPSKQATGARIAQARERLGWSQGKLADKLGITRAAVWQWETGQTGLSLGVFMKLPGILGVSWEWLTGEEPEDPTASVSSPSKMKEIGKRISIARIRKYMTIDDIAGRLNVDSSSILSWERGVEMPDMMQFDILGDFLGVTRQWLLAGHEDEQILRAQDVIELEVLQAIRLLNRQQQVAHLNDMYATIDGNPTERNRLKVS